MPAAVAIPLVLAGASMVASNVQNKAAIKNNDNQNAAAVGNAQNAFNTARTNLADWTKNNPSPFASATIGRPTGAFGVPYQPSNVNASSLFSQPGAGQLEHPGATPQPASNPIAGLIMHLMSQGHPPAAGVPPQAAQPMPAPLPTALPRLVSEPHQFRAPINVRMM